MKTRVFLIGGASASGKTTLAKKLGKHLGLPWFSTDYIHDIALTMAKREDFPEAFNVRDYSAEEFYDKYSIEDVVQSEIAISHEVWPGVRTLVDSGFEGVIEGVAVIPELVNSLKDVEGIQVVYIINDNAEDIFKIAQTRGIWDLSHLYSDSVRKKEVEFVLGYNEYLKKEAEKYGYPVVVVNRDDTDLEKIINILE